jgi:hypothetical protein
MVRLGFEDWGEQNGGVQEQSARYENAKDAAAKAITALERIKAK